MFFLLLLIQLFNYYLIPSKVKFLRFPPMILFIGNSVSSITSHEMIDAVILFLYLACLERTANGIWLRIALVAVKIFRRLFPFECEVITFNRILSNY